MAGDASLARSRFDATAGRRAAPLTPRFQIRAEGRAVISSAVKSAAFLFLYLGPSPDLIVCSVACLSSRAVTRISGLMYFHVEKTPGEGTR